MKLYLVYDNSFDCERPRNGDCDPYIVLTTTDKYKAINKVVELYKGAKTGLYEYVEDVELHIKKDTSFEYRGYRTYGKCGIKIVNVEE